MDAAYDVDLPTWQSVLCYRCGSGERFLDECSWLGVWPMFLPPHSSDQTQPMDLGIFARQKAEASRIRPIQGLNPQSKQLIKMLSGYEIATLPQVIIGAFRRTGIANTWSDEHQTLLVQFDRSLARGVREWPLNKARVELMAEEVGVDLYD
jgi:hypothetical protein